MNQTLHQFVTGATAGDAITGHALTIRKWLIDMGFESHIYAEHIHDSMKDEIRPLTAYRVSRVEPWVIYHHSIGSNVADYLLERELRIILIYHNVTPPEFFAKINPGWAQLAHQGYRQLESVRPAVSLALAVSAYNEQDLRQAGYADTGVLPIVLEEHRYTQPTNEQLAQEMQRSRPLLLFVGRLTPNKKQEDLVKLLYYYRRIEPGARLILVGDRWEIGYDHWIEEMAISLDLADAVTITGKVSDQDLITYYRTADLFVSMSEHEGFGKPLIESMYLGLPVLAYGAAAVPTTLDGTGALFYKKDYERLAELVHLLITDIPLRRRLISSQRKRVESFLEPSVRQSFDSHLGRLHLDQGRPAGK